MTPRQRICDKCWNEKDRPAVVAGMGGAGSCDICGSTTNSFMELHRSALQEIVHLAPGNGEDVSFGIARHALGNGSS
jgi:hypothetical protein